MAEADELGQPGFKADPTASRAVVARRRSHTAPVDAVASRPAFARREASSPRTAVGVAQARTPCHVGRRGRHAGARHTRLAHAATATAGSTVARVARHVDAHAAAHHVGRCAGGEACATAQSCPGAQRLPQLPQLVGSELTSVHAEPHMIRGAGQVLMHAPPLHTCPALHARPHIPQLDPSVSGLTHAEPHRSCPTGHVQRPPEHAVPAGHAVPQAPQLPLSEEVSTQAPPHIMRGAVQPVTLLQVPPLHTCVEVQRVPHAPQFDSSVCVSRQNAPQSVRPVGQPIIMASGGGGLMSGGGGLMSGGGGLMSGGGGLASPASGSGLLPMPLPPRAGPQAVRATRIRAERRVYGRWLGMNEDSRRGDGQRTIVG